MKSVWRAFDVDQWEEEQAWLNEQAKKGLELSHLPVFGCIYWFDEVANSDVNYAIDVADTKKYQDPSFREMLSETGWEIMGSRLPGIHYLRRKSGMAGAETMYSEESEQIPILKKIVRFYNTLLGLLVLPVALGFFNYYQASRPENSHIELNMWVFVSGMLLMLAGMVVVFAKRARLKRRLSEIKAHSD